MKSKDELLEKIEDLGPWHHKIQLTQDIWTGSTENVDKTGARVSFHTPLQTMKAHTQHALPNGFEGRSFLDCACNGGGYSFAAKDLGASRVFGFDVRDHWIKQCEFVMQHREASSDNMEFRKADLLDISFLDEEFDVTWFSGLFYHLPDPVTGLKNAADRTKELIFVNTNVSAIQPNEVETPALHLKLEGTEQLMSGVHRLSWMPSGPKVMERILNWLGFPETRLIFWKQPVHPNGEPDTGRLCMVGARQADRLKNVSNATPVSKPLMPGAKD